MKKFCIENKKHIIYILVILIVGTIISLPLLDDKLNVLRDDGIQHVLRIKETAECITNFESTKISNNLCNSFGYSWDIFYGNFTSIIPAFIYLIVGSGINTFKIFLYILLILSGISMYVSTYKMFRKHEISAISSIIYMCAPYHLNDMYIRYAVAEFASFIFIPLIFSGLYCILNNEDENEKEENSDSGLIMLVLGSSGLIITHLISTAITACFALLYLLFNFKKLKNIKIIRKICIASLLIIMISSYFWIPLLENSINTDYEVYEKDKMSSTESVNYHRVDLKDLISNKDNFQIHELGLVIIALTLLTLYSIWKMNKEDRKFVLIFLFFGIISILVTTKLINWNYVPKIFLFIQFPWRMLEFSTYFLSLVASISFCSAIKNVRLIDVLYIVIITVLLTGLFKDRIEYSDKKVEEPKIGIVHEKSTLGTNAGSAKFEYLPKKAYDNIKYMSEREDKIYVLDGNCEIKNEYKSGKSLEAEIKLNSENVKLELPYTYYLGYSVYVDGNKVKTEESEMGFLEVNINKEDIIKSGSSKLTESLDDENKEYSKLVVKYTGTILDNVSKIISIIGILLIFLIIVKYNKTR